MRALLLAVLALALAIAPAAPCTMGRHAAAHGATAAGVVVPTSHVHPAGARRNQVGPGAAGIHATAHDVPAAVAVDEECSGHRHRPKHPTCPATCCPLVFQAALPTLPWAGVPLDFRPSDRVLIVQEDEVVDAHPLRIERPPRRGA